MTISRKQSFEIILFAADDNKGAGVGQGDNDAKFARYEAAQDYGYGCNHNGLATIIINT